MINKKPILVVFAISIALIFLMAPVASASHSISPATATSTNYQPDPTLNVNSTWSTFYHGWNATEYNNGTGNASLNAGLSSFYANPISVNPTDIQAIGSIQNNNITGLGRWSNTSIWKIDPYSIGTTTLTAGTIGKATDLTMTGTGNSTTGGTDNAYLTIPIADYASPSPAFNYITGIYTLSGTAVTGVSANIGIGNDTAEGNISSISIIPGQSVFFSEPVTDFIGTSLNTTPGQPGYASEMTINLNINTPSGSTDSWTMTLTGLALTDYQMSIGTNSTGSAINKAVNPTMSSFSPSFSYQSVINGGYTVALSASPNNLTQVQTPITSGNYIEQVQYSGTFQLPSSPDLSYGAANITFPVTVPASQVQVLTLGGTSYINSLGNKTNGTVQLVTAVDPTSPTSYYSIVEFTASQWQSISHPAGFFTYDGIAYYYWLAIGAIASLLALGVGVRHAKTKREQTEKVDRITRRGR